MAFSLSNIFKPFTSAFRSSQPYLQTGLFRNPSPSVYAGPRAPSARTYRGPTAPRPTAPPAPRTDDGLIRPAPFSYNPAPFRPQPLPQIKMAAPVAPTLPISAVSGAPALPLLSAAAPSAPKIGYGDLENRTGAIVNRQTGYVYPNNEAFAKDLGILPHQIDWTKINNPSAQAPPPQAQGGALDYSHFVMGLDNTVYQVDDNKNVVGPVKSNQELAQKLGIQPHEIDWNQIRPEREALGGQTPAGTAVLATPAAEQGPTISAPNFALSPEVQKAITDASSAYEKSLQLSPDELSTQSEVDALLESTKKGYLNAQQQPIAMDFITGQLKAIENRATALAEPLERKLSRLQAARQSALEASRFALERADKTAERETSLAQQRFENQISVANLQETIAQNHWARDYDDRQFEESKRQFGLDYALREKDLAQNIKASDRDYQFAIQQFDEDKKRWGLEYILSKEKFGLDLEQFGFNKAMAERDLAMKAAEAVGKNQPSEYSIERATRTVQSVDELLIQADKYPGIFGRSAAVPVPDFLRSGEFRNFKAQLNTLESNIAFGELTAMREASSSGGALGQVSDRESKLLASALGALDMSQDPAMFKAQLQKIKDSIQRWQNAKLQYGGGSDSYTDPSTGKTYHFSLGGGGTPTATGMRTDRNNNPTAFTTDIARQAGLREGVDYTRGDAFPGSRTTFTARLLGDAADITRRVIDRIGFYTGSGQQRWSHTAMPKGQWDRLSTAQKNQIIASMYKREGGSGVLNKYFA